jgi:hypothetical protein
VGSQSDGRHCEICDQHRVSTRQRVRFEDGLDTIVEICEGCLADAIANGTVVLITDHRNQEGDVYLVERITDKRVMQYPSPFGPGASSDVVARADRMEMWGSSFDASGPDFCEFRLFDALGDLIAVQRVAGY